MVHDDVVLAPRPRQILLAVLATVLFVAGPLAVQAPAASTKTLKNQLEEAAESLDQAETVQGRVSDDLQRLNRELAKAEAQLRDVQARLAKRVRLMYTGGMGGDVVEVMITSSDPASVLDRLSLLEAASRDDRAVIARAKVTRHHVESVRSRVALARRASDQSLAALEREQRRLRTLLGLAEDADAAARRASRASRLRSPTFSGNYACLVGPAHAFSDTWGNRRSGGRRHKGADVFAANGAPAYAVTSGRISRWSSGGLGGISVYLRGDDGNEYYYAHMSRNVARPGSRVTAGELISYVGNTGNARGGPAHIHFELHPRGGRPVNPTPFLRRIC